MPENKVESRSAVWEKLAGTYASSRQVSADRLVEWPAQLKMCGAFHGMRVLDVGCGTGEKARFFAEQGAAEVIGVDPSEAFSQFWSREDSPCNLRFARGSFEDFVQLPDLRERAFELVVSFQALMYAADLRAAVASMADVLAPMGTLVVSVPHPFRFAILRNEREGWGPGDAYQQTGAYRYPSPWDDAVFLEHGMPRISDYVNAFANAGLRIEAMDEPGPTEELRSLSPEKAAWMDRYVGILILKARRST